MEFASVPSRATPVPDDSPAPYSPEDYGSFAEVPAHSGLWSYNGALCTKCKSISPQTLARLVTFFNTDHMVEVTYDDPERLVSTLRSLADRIEEENQ